MDANLFHQIVVSEGADYHENYQKPRKRRVIDLNEFAKMKTKFEPNISKSTGFTELYLKDCYKPSSKTNSGEGLKESALSAVFLFNL